MPPRRGFSGLSYWERTLGKNQNTSERLDPSAGLGSLVVSLEELSWLPPLFRPRPKKVAMDGWMDDRTTIIWYNFEYLNVQMCL